MSEGEHRVIIKRPIIAAGHHGGAWKIAYADFMTAMFAFFLVMWLLASASPKQLKGIAEHFKTPLVAAITGKQQSATGSGAIPGGATPIMTPSDSDSEAENEAVESKRMDELKKRLDGMIDSSPVLQQYRPQLLVDVTPEGLRVQIVDTNNRPMFNRSSAVVEPYMRTILRELGPVLNAQPTRITLSGHTDQTQYSQGDKSYSNWELSADRANASRRELVAGGMDDNKVLRIMGVASSMPLNTDDPYAAINRRISITVLNTRTQNDIENANAAVAKQKPAVVVEQSPFKIPGVAEPAPKPAH